MESLCRNIIIMIIVMIIVTTANTTIIISHAIHSPAALLGTGAGAQSQEI